MNRPAPGGQAAGQGLVLLALAWGVLAFGSPYPWAYWPLAGIAATAGVAGLVAGRGTKWPGLALTGGLAAVGLAIGLQLVPLPPSILLRINPHTVDAAQRLDLVFAQTPGSPHAISLAPERTLLALVLYIAFALLMLGTARLLSSSRVVPLVSNLAILGTVVALIGLGDPSLATGRIYGFWKPYDSGSPYGPFVNRNHFAGWMLMAFPLAWGLLCARLLPAMSRVKPGARNLFLWMSSPEANKLILLAMAVAVMALSIVFSRCRSGFVALGLATVLLLWFLKRGRSVVKTTLGLSLLVLVIVAVAWGGLGSLLERFSVIDWAGLNHRRGAWSDAWRIALVFPLAGTGINTYDTVIVLFQQYDLGQHYSAAHNDYLQLAAEGGILVCLPVAWCAVAFVRQVRRRLEEDSSSSAYWVRAGAVTALAAIAFQESVDFSLQMPGNAAMFAVVCGIALHRSPSGGRSQSSTLRRVSDAAVS